MAAVGGKLRGTVVGGTPFSREAHALVKVEGRPRPGSGRLVGVLALLLLASAVRVGVAIETPPATPGPGRNVLGFDRFVAASTPVCLHRPAAACVETGWAFADRDEDQGLSLVELEEVRNELRSWTQWRADDLHPMERSLLALGFVVVDGLGLERLHGVFDQDGDGLVDRDELLADVRLDERPLGEILLDREAVDRAAIAARLGLPPIVLERLQP
jgi:hypothetical protein